MFDEENPWSPWLAGDGFAHPNASMHGGDFKRTSGPATGRTSPLNPYSPAGLSISPEQAAEGYAAFEFSRVASKIALAVDGQDLLAAARAAFGPNSFSERFGTALRGTANGRHYLELQRLMMRAELQDHLCGRVPWPLGEAHSLDFQGPELWQVGQHLRFTRIHLLCNQTLLKKAVESRDALLTELTALFTEGDGALAAIKAQLKPETLEHWTKYSDLARSNTPANRGDTGWFLGSSMLAVLSAVAAQAQATGFAAKLAGTAPQLLALGQSLPAGMTVETTGKAPSATTSVAAFEK